MFPETTEIFFFEFSRYKPTKDDRFFVLLFWVPNPLLEDFLKILIAHRRGFYLGVVYFMDSSVCIGCTFIDLNVQEIY